MKRLFAALPLRMALGVIEALSAGGADALGRISVLCREASTTLERDLRSSARKDRFRSSVVKDIEKL